MNFNKSPRFSATLTQASIAALVLGLGLAGCASSMSKKDCETTDFYQMGLQDGKDGKTADRLSKVKNECTSQGVAVTDNKYTYGRQVGLAQYCTESRGKDDAKDGKGDSICLKEAVPPYDTAYRAKLTERKAQTAEDLAKVQKSQAELQQKQSKLQGDLKQIDQQAGSTPVAK